MKNLIALCTLVALIAGCTAGSSWNAGLGQSTPPVSTNPESKLIVEKEVQPMSRNEVITAINECESAGTRPVVVYSKRKINGFNSDVVVDVSCAPKFKL